MPWIINVSRDAVRTGEHIISANCMLIQIADPDAEFPQPKHDFTEVHQFHFLDAEDNSLVPHENMRCSFQQAAELVQLIQHAMDSQMDIVVHCAAGICRSGAVCEVGTMMGMQDKRSFRIPNTLVKNRMMRALGWTYDAD